MGNCQATEAATAVIQHPGGKLDRLYWPTTASEVMKSNPGHYVALVTLYVSQEKPDGGGAVRFTRVKLLKPKDMLLLGQVYRLITSQEVAKAIRARKEEKMKKSQEDQSTKDQKQKHQQTSDSRTDHQSTTVEAIKDRRRHDSENTDQAAAAAKPEPERQRHSTQKARQWRPSLQSISEAGS